MKIVLIVALLVCLAVALAMIFAPSGPRVTTIETRRGEDNDADGADR